MRVRLATTVVHVPGTRMPSDGPPPGITHLTVAGFVGNTWLTPHAFPALDIIAILMNVSEEGAGAFGLLPQPASDSGNDQHDEPYDDQSPQHPYRRKRQPPTPGAMRLDDPLGT